MPYHIDFENGLMQFTVTLTYRISRGCRQTWESPEEPDSIDDLRVNCIHRVQLSSGANRHFLAPRDERESSAYLRMLNEWLEDNREAVERDVWDYEAELTEAHRD
jgi:hypothetical protein